MRSDARFKPGDFTGWFAHQCRAAGLPAGCSAHGLWKAASAVSPKRGARPAPSHRWAARSRAVRPRGRSGEDGGHGDESCDRSLRGCIANM